MKKIDPDLLLCVFIFLLLVAIYIATNDPKIETLMQMFGGGSMMGLKSGMGIQVLGDSTTVNQPSGQATVNQPTTTTDEEKPKE